MASLGDVRFSFINDTKQGALLSYSRTQTPLQSGETLQIVGNYVHFTVATSNWRKTGDESNAASDFGTGYLELDFPAAFTQIYTIQWMTYYTNGAYKEVLMRIDPLPGSHIRSYNPV